MINPVKNILSYIVMISQLTYKEPSESPLVPDNFILDDTIGTAWYSIDSIVATHDAGSTALTHAGLKCWEIGL